MYFREASRRSQIQAKRGALLTSRRKRLNDQYFVTICSRRAAGLALPHIVEQVGPGAEKRGTTMFAHPSVEGNSIFPQDFCHPSS